MLKHFPYNKMVFVSNSICMTNAPDRWAVLKSQRRRWINSTVHNLAELLWIDSLCGFCCFSMRFIVMLDLFSTIVGPVGVCYLVYLIGTIVYQSLFGVPGIFPMISFILLAAIYGLQALIFIIKRDFQHIGWMLIYILAIPVFNLMLPMYSFWHFDDFSWGSTRVILGEGGKKQIISKEVDTFNINQIPHKKWSEYSLEVKDVLEQRPNVFQQQRQMSWFVDATATSNNTRMSSMFTATPTTTPVVHQLRQSMMLQPTSAITKRQPYLLGGEQQQQQQQQHVSNEVLLKRCREIVLSGVVDKKEIIKIVQQEYQMEFDVDRMGLIVDAALI